ncbi:Hypothetical predicted protein [Olea europaea subsp. europaea]|uniref:Uncharacterized protein n=1 Tax=Olea europaea subsp. europaea TaxID=158383 RepID=A0A8S0VGR3_OLEEU|nr:Hypothetical predicted protein [Olea europaea subsp. europaea]
MENWRMTGRGAYCFSSSLHCFTLCLLLGPATGARRTESSGEVQHQRPRPPAGTKKKSRTTVEKEKGARHNSQSQATRGLPSMTSFANRARRDGEMENDWPRRILLLLISALLHTLFEVNLEASRANLKNKEISMQRFAGKADLKSVDENKMKIKRIQEGLKLESAEKNDKEKSFIIVSAEFVERTQR